MCCQPLDVEGSLVRGPVLIYIDRDCSNHSCEFNRSMSDVVEFCYNASKIEEVHDIYMDIL